MSIVHKWKKNREKSTIYKQNINKVLIYIYKMNKVSTIEVMITYLLLSIKSGY
ncbi:protein of unknown function [Clostridium beijerinckii]|nr:protein of unknown function [Clostridium beijerinckii]